MEIVEDMDAVFLPGKIHGCDWQVYIIYLNPCANEGKGSFEIEIIDAERILRLYDEVNGDAEAFFGILPDWFHGEWRYNRPPKGAKTLRVALLLPIYIPPILWYNSNTQCVIGYGIWI